MHRLPLLLLFLLPATTPLSPDGLALLAFKAAVTDDPSAALSTWNDTDADPCRWAGVTCANATVARVVGVSVAGKNISGYIPSELGSLLFLRRLNLHGNRLAGAVPAALSNASSLHSVFLYNNALTGPFPDALCQLPRLQNLDLSGNRLAGELPGTLRDCRGLQRLLLAANNFSGVIPAGVFPAMADLIQLDLSSNQFAGAIPPDIGELPALTGTLNLSHNRLSGPVPAALGRLPPAVNLDVRFNNLSGEIPSNGSLANQGPTAFLNNPFLCGFPLQIPCAPGGDSPPPPELSLPPPESAPEQRSKGSVRTNVILLVALADAAGVALLGVAGVYIYWKFKDRGGCAKKAAADPGDSSSAEEDDAAAAASNGAGDGMLVAVDKGFSVDLDELLRSSAYVLGKGGKGIVYKVVVANGMPVAVRRLGGGGASVERSKEFAGEAAAIGKARHPNVVRLRAFYWSADEKLIITDYIASGNLAAALRGKSGHPSLSWSNRLLIAKGAARGLAYLHEFSSKRSVHGDVKPSNILLDGDYNAYIADFGLHRLIAIAGCSTDAAFPPGFALPFTAKPPALQDRSGEYRAPEARAAAGPTQKCDVYAFGVVLMELLTGRPTTTEQMSPSTSSSSGQAPELVRLMRKAFDEGRPVAEMVDASLAYELAHGRKAVAAVFELALRCTEPDPEQRPRMKAVSEMLDKAGG